MQCSMQGKLDKSDGGRWAIVNEVGDREEITSGDVIEVYVYRRAGWVRTRIESHGGAYYAVAGVPLYSGQPARSTDTPRYLPG